jgi:hypothetical protein
MHRMLQNLLIPKNERGSLAVTVSIHSIGHRYGRPGGGAQYANGVYMAFYFGPRLLPDTQAVVNEFAGAGQNQGVTYSTLKRLFRHQQQPLIGPNLIKVLKCQVDMDQLS